MNPALKPDGRDVKLCLLTQSMSAWEDWPAPVSAGSVYGGAGQTEGHFLRAEALSEAAGRAWTAELRGRAPVAAAAAGQPGETLGSHRHAGPSVADQTERLAGQRPGHICFTLQLQSKQDNIRCEYKQGGVCTGSAVSISTLWMV